MVQPFSQNNPILGAGELGYLYTHSRESLVEGCLALTWFRKKPSVTDADTGF